MPRFVVEGNVTFTESRGESLGIHSGEEVKATPASCTL